MNISFVAVPVLSRHHSEGNVPSLLLGMTAVLVTYPLDMIRARLAFQVAGEDIYLGIRHAIKVIVTKEGGVMALYRGIVPTMIGMVPYAGK